MDSEIIENNIFDYAWEGKTSLLMAPATDGIEIDCVAENKTWYTPSVANFSKNKEELVTSKIVKV